MVVTITLTTIGADTGPTFDLYANVGGWTAVALDVDGSLLLAPGYTLEVPDGTTIVRVRSHENSVCMDYLDIPLMGNGPQIFFNFISPQAEAVMGINNSIGASYYISFNYNINAYVDNTLDPTKGHAAITKFELSTNGGSNWNTVATARAEVDGGIARSDTDSKSGTTSIGGIINVSNVRARISMNCGVDTIGVSMGGGDVTIGSALPNSGTVTIICQNKYVASCEELSDTFTLDCTIPA